ncbi:MAG: DUF1304 domain-containing protein [Pseudonocardiaceae bacterium]
MEIAAKLVVALVAMVHLYFLVLEMFLWRRDRIRAIFGTTPQFAEASAVLAANQGLYNGFLAAGLVFGLIAGGDLGFAVTVFVLSCVIVAGVYGGFTVNRRVVFVQALPAALALLLTLLAR